MARKKSKKKGVEQQRPLAQPEEKKNLSRKEFEKELYKLQVELCNVQEWVKRTGAKVAIVFEGRDTAGKGGVIKRITERVSPRVFRVVALPAPTDREKSQFYLQRYIAHLPAAGEIVIFDRSWYNRAMVEKVMGFCTQNEYESFMRICPGFERELIDSGIILLKYFLFITQEEQERRFNARMEDPVKYWKLSPMDVESVGRWWDYTDAINKMTLATDTKYAPWNVVDGNNKRRARLNCISHLLSQIPYEAEPFKAPKLPKRKNKPADVPEHPMFRNIVPEKY